MEIISKISDLQARIAAYRAEGKQIGLVPTMELYTTDTFLS